MAILEDWKRLYSRLITSNVGIKDENDPLCRAFREVPREKFVGPGPWKLFTPAGFVETPSADPAFLYQDVVIVLGVERGINNGQPSLHAACLAALGVGEGHAVVHVGAGAGYYTAILAHLVGQTGNVTAYEIEEQLAQRATENLQGVPNIDVLHRSGAIGPLPSADVIYVNAGATEPVPAWLDALKPGGRLLFPLTPDKGFGGMLLVAKKSDNVFGARFVSRAMFIPCIDARDPDMASKLTVAFQRGDWLGVRSLHRGSDPDESCWVSGSGWWLSKS